MGSTVKLWDPLVRLFHWSIAGIFVANYWLNEEGDDWHQWLGYTAASLIGVRLLWGFIGPRPARWADFFPTPAKLKAHLCALVKRRDYHRMGHTPLGAVVMILMMLGFIGLAVTGYMMAEIDRYWGVQWVEDIHGYIANTLLALVILHIAAALYESLQLKENLPLSMITGKRKDRDKSKT
ncbi:cytochrome b/b6 domain-containing protein [Gilvimarinus algae]|uniref:Cytochrome b/b6 domain-containing protein n=1 Tax=Gilvimarinus algae TaxID=3058037 RepID=A0ABT8TEC9_9GAMM|nr:cytochrome b/b6 domain-containing protein [Gilvimarinus sp. SDUM040014]MDO3382456.1 cytochrome b/b6 domain-containing protein [Gilvimarinus sp. SDUM040014]